MDRHACREQQTHLLESTGRMVDIATAPGIDVAWKLRRLSSVVVADFPRALYKLQVLGEDGILRVISDFVTPLLQGIIDRLRSSIGPLDVREARLPTGTDSLIETGILASEPIRLSDPEEIERYYAAHFTTADRTLLGKTIRDELRVREVLLIPVRRDELPFGVLSLSTTSPLDTAGLGYWRTVASLIGIAYRESAAGLRESLESLALASSQVATVLVDGGGVPLDINRAAVATLGFESRDAALRHLGTMKPCLPARSALDSEPVTPGAFYLADAYGNEIAFEVSVEPLPDATGAVRGAVVRLHPSDDLESRSLRLTRRQREVARLISEGRTTKEVAGLLGLSIHTVNYHRSQIRDRLDGDGKRDDLRTAIRRYFLGRR